MSASCTCGLDDAFPARLARWLLANRDLVDALIALRRLGAEGEDAVAELLHVQRVAVMRLSFELWTLLVAPGSGDVEALLYEHIPREELARLQFAVGVEHEPPAQMTISPNANLLPLAVTGRRIDR